MSGYTYAFKILLILSLFLMSICCKCWREIMINYILGDIKLCAYSVLQERDLLLLILLTNV